MASRQYVEVIDDLTGEAGADTIMFGLDGRDYAIDLTDDNAEKLRGLFAQYISHGRPARTVGRKRNTSQRRTSPAQNLTDIREWAANNGYSVKARGRVPASVTEAYVAAGGR
jgi:hypothetical protein